MKNIFEKVDFKRFAVCVILTAVFLGLAYASYFIQKKYYSQMEDALINKYFAPAQKMQAEYIAGQLGNKINNIFSVLKTAAEYKNLQNISDKCRQDQKEAMEQIAVFFKGEINHIILINNKGKVICSTLREMEEKDISGLPHIQEQLSSKKPVVSRLFVNSLGKKIISFISPIFSEKGEYLGALGVTLGEEHLRKFLSPNYFFAVGNYSALNDDDGTILYHPNESFIGENFFGEKMQEVIKKDQDLNNMYKKMMAGKTGYNFYTFMDNVKVAGYAPIYLQNGDRFWSVASTANLKDYAIFTEPFFVKGLIINLFLIIDSFILIILVIYLLLRLRERERGSIKRNNDKKIY